MIIAMKNSQGDVANEQIINENKEKKQPVGFFILQGFILFFFFMVWAIAGYLFKNDIKKQKYYYIGITISSVVLGMIFIAIDKYFSTVFLINTMLLTLFCIIMFINQEDLLPVIMKKKRKNKNKEERNKSFWSNSRFMNGKKINWFFVMTAIAYLIVCGTFWLTLRSIVNSNWYWVFLGMSMFLFVIFLIASILDLFLHTKLEKFISKLENGYKKTNNEITKETIGITKIIKETEEKKPLKLTEVTNDSYKKID